MSQIERILWIICIIESLVIGYLIFGNKPQIVEPNIKTVEIIRDSLIRDSIYIINEAIEAEIEDVQKQYQKDSSNIMSASDSVLFESFTRYINDYNNK